MSEKVDKSIPLFDSQFLYQLERLAILSRQSVAGQLQGERRSPKRGQSVEFSDFRPYALGDDFRRIDWNAYARLEKFFIKLFVEEEDITVHLLIDTSASMDWGQPNKLEYAIRTAAALGYISLVGLDRTTVTAIGQEDSKNRQLPPQRGKKQAHKFFSFLQHITPAAKTDLVKELRSYRASSRYPGLLILLTDLFEPSWREALNALVDSKFEISLLHILSPDEIDPGYKGDLKLLDSETNAEVEITADFNLIQNYKANLAEWKTEIHKYCSQRHINYIPLVTSLPLQELLFSLLQRQALLK